MNQPEENIGKLCQAFAINLDKMTYKSKLQDKIKGPQYLNVLNHDIKRKESMCFSF